MKKTFPDFSSKMKSPDFIVPEEGFYEKQASYDELNNSFGNLKQSTAHAELAELVEGLPLRTITRLEILLDNVVVTLKQHVRNFQVKYNTPLFRNILASEYYPARFMPACTKSE